MLKIKDLPSTYRRTLINYAGMGVPYYFLPDKVREWIESGGYEKLKEEKPLTAKLVDKMRRDIYPPEDLGLTTKFARGVENEMKRRGIISEDDVIYGNEIYEIFTFKRNPYGSNSDRMFYISKVATDILKDLVEKNPKREDLKVVKKIFETWYKIAKRIREARGKDV